MAKAIPYEFVLDYLPPGIIVKKMFGMHYIYLAKKIVLILRKRDNEPELNGIWVATDKEHHQSLKKDIPEFGPFFIDGAEPGDTLAVKFLEIKVDSNQGIGALAPGFGAINSTNYTPMLNAPIKEKIWFYPIDHATNTATFQALDSKFTVKFPLHPFYGCIGVAPAGGEARSSVVPGASSSRKPETRPGSSISGTLPICSRTAGARPRRSSIVSRRS